MSNTIQIKRSSTAASVPTAGQLAVGELAVNLADKKLFTKDASNAVVELGAGVALTGDQTIAGVKTFSSSPVVPNATTATQAVAFGQITGKGITTATAVSASGTSIDFTSIPSWVKRITVMLNGVSTNGASVPLLQIGAGSVTTSGYTGATGYAFNGAATVSGAQTTGFGLTSTFAGVAFLSGSAVLTNVSGNIWVFNVSGYQATNAFVGGGGNITLGGTLDRVRITTVNGTDTFDAGSINILMEG